MNGDHILCSGNYCTHFSFNLSYSYMQFINEHVTYYVYFRLVGQIGHVSKLYYKTNSIYANEKIEIIIRKQGIFLFKTPGFFFLYFEFRIRESVPILLCVLFIHNINTFALFLFSPNEAVTRTKTTMILKVGCSLKIVSF